MVKFLEQIVFSIRIPILVILAAVTVWTGYEASQLKRDAGFDKQLPAGHEYIETFQEYRDRLFGANRLIIVVQADEGDVWSVDFMTKLKEVTDDIFFLPGVDRRTVTSLWTPNTRYFEITEEGFRADNVIPGTVTVGNMSEDNIATIQNNVIRGGYVGRLVSNDFTAAMITAELTEIDPETQEPLNYFDLAEKLETEIRDKHESEDYSIHIIGFAKLIGDIADGAQSVIVFFIVAFFVTILLVIWYSQSIILTFLAVFCSLVSLIWQFGILAMMGIGLDPLAILVPFLVFAIGVSHGVQQLNLISAEIEKGASSEQAARASFTGLLVPGSMALVTDLVGFGSLYLIPIPMIQELAITASIGVLLKIVTNLIMLPILASYFQFGEGYVRRVRKAREFRLKIMAVLGKVAEPRIAITVFVVVTSLFAVAVYQSQGRHVGDLHAGSPELHPDARYNQDSRLISSKFSIGLNLLTVVVETPSEACIKYPYMDYLNRFSWYMENVPGVLSVASAPFAAKQSNAGWNEGNPKWRALPRNQFSLVQATSPIPTSTGLLNNDCTVMTLQIFTEDNRAETIETVIEAIKEWRAENVIPPALSAGTDRKDGSWVLEEGDLDGLTFQPQLMAEDSYRLRLTAIEEQEVEAASLPEDSEDRPEAFSEGQTVTIENEIDAGTLTIQVPEDLGRTQIDLRAALDEAGIESFDRLVVEGVPASTYVRLASGNVGVAAATNEVVEESELPMMLVVYAAIITMVFLTYWDWRATVACCLPLTFATFFGYWFMKELEIGLKVATLPVMVLAVGLGVDYAFYIYNRVQYHLSQGLDITLSYKNTMKETGMAVVFVALTMACGVLTWVLSDLKFQADMGLLLFFMFMTNMIMAITALPATAVILDMLFPRKKPPRAPAGALAH